MTKMMTLIIYLIVHLSVDSVFPYSDGIRCFIFLCLFVYFTTLKEKWKYGDEQRKITTPSHAENK